MTSDNEATSRIQLPAAPVDQQEIIDAGGVGCWSEPVTIDTYEAASPDRYPLFLDRRVYQGSSGRVYPMPMTDAVSHEKRPREWQAIHLENVYVRLLLLPELGGRIHIGYDKIAGYDFFYRNNVIKPALVGLAGPWISGGVEFNWPQHHRPATFLPVDARVEREPDGAVVVWHSDLDQLQRMRGVHGVRLRPGSSLIEADVRLHNRTDVPQTFLWWANVAARSHEQYQSFFPDDVAYVADHARRAITAFPRADRPYYGVDYPALAAESADADRIDIYSNIPVPTSYMITDTEEAFFGGYDHAADAGFVHWADRAISPGKKQWTWGTGEIGRAWDAQLTDEDGPYVELMAGVYTDNQPDFAWLVPGETKRFSQYWFPIHAIGAARQASTDAAIAVTPDGSRAGVIATRALDAVITIRTAEGEYERAVALAPDAPFSHESASRIVEVIVRAAGAAPLVWQDRAAAAAEPWVATAPPAPEDISSEDELFLTATHLDQYRHPTRSAVPYLREALARDASDTRAATALAAWHLRRAEYETAAELLERAIARQTRRNLNPRDGEALYMLGLVRERQGDLAAADRHLARAGWNAVWAAPAQLGRARIALREGRPADALALAESASAIPEARRLVVLALHALGRDADAEQALRMLRSADPLDAATAVLADVLGLEGAIDAPADPRTVLEAACELARAGAHGLALAATATAPSSRAAAFGNAEPMRRVLRASWALAIDDDALAQAELAELGRTATDLAFPAGLDHVDALTAAGDAHRVVLALRGMWLLDAGRDEDALTALRGAIDAGSEDPVAWRNLAIAVMRTSRDVVAADEAYARALELGDDARLVFERDLLARIAGATPRERLERMEARPALLAERDDLALAHVVALLDVDRVQDAWGILTSRVFRPFEGGEGRVIAAYDRAACALAAELLAEGSSAEAVELLESGIEIPANLGEGRHPAEPYAERLVLLGDARAAQGDHAGARAAWQQARTATPLAVAERPVDERDRWRGVAHLRLAEAEQADAVWTALERRADDLERERDAVDYFATSLPELMVFDVDTAAARRASAAVLRALAVEGRALQVEAGRMGA
ncbi:DUF5107 domain-containing protein [Microbacterium sp. NPDC055903]